MHGTIYYVAAYLGAVGMKNAHKRWNCRVQYKCFGLDAVLVLSVPKFQAQFVYVQRDRMRNDLEMTHRHRHGCAEHSGWHHEQTAVLALRM
jgi:hypothetical protein